MSQNYVPLAFEIVTYVFAGVMGVHVWKHAKELKEQDGAWEDGDEANRARWLSTLLWGIFFGYVVECALSAGNEYVYLKQIYLIPLLPNPLDHEKPVPLWVAVGWGILLYSTTWTAQRLKQPRFARAMLGALLAVDIDLSLDPIARFFGMWSGPAQYANYYTVPFDNFTGWFLIVFLFTLFTRSLFETKVGSKPTSAIWVPGVGAAIALGAVYGIDYLLPYLYKKVGGDFPVFVVLFAGAWVIVTWRSQRLKRDYVPSWPILALPVVFHSLSWLVLLVAGDCMSTAHADRMTLLVGIPLALAVGFVAFGWASIDKLFPRSTETPSEAATQQL